MVNIYNNYENILVKETFNTKQYASNKTLLFDKIGNYIRTTEDFGTNNNGKVSNVKLGPCKSHKIQDTEQTKYHQLHNSNGSASVEVTELDYTDESNGALITNLYCSIEGDILFSNINNEQIYDFNVNNKTYLDDVNFLSSAYNHSISETIDNQSSILDYCNDNKRLEVCSNTEELVLKNDNYIDLDIEAERLSKYFSYLEHLDPKKYIKEIQIINNALVVKKQSTSCPSNINASKNKRLMKNKIDNGRNNKIEKINNCKTIQSTKKNGKSNINNFTNDNVCNNNLYILKKSDIELLHMISSENIKNNKTNIDLDNYKERLIFNGEISVLQTMLEDTMDKINYVSFRSLVIIVENNCYDNLILCLPFVELRSIEIITKYNSCHIFNIFDFKYRHKFDCNTSNINLKAVKLPLHKRLLKRFKQKMSTSKHERKKSRSSLNSDTFQNEFVHSWYYKNKSLRNGNSKPVFMPSNTQFTADANMSNSNFADENNELVYYDKMLIDKGNNFGSGIDTESILTRSLEDKLFMPDLRCTMENSNTKKFHYLADEPKRFLGKEDATFCSTEEIVYNDILDDDNNDDADDDDDDDDDSSKLLKTLNDINTLVSITGCSTSKKVLDNDAFVTTKTRHFLLNEQNKLNYAKMIEINEADVNRDILPFKPVKCPNDLTAVNKNTQLKKQKNMNYDVPTNTYTIINSKLGAKGGVFNTNACFNFYKKPVKVVQCNNKGKESKVKKNRFICIPYCQGVKKPSHCQDVYNYPQPDMQNFSECYYHSLYNKTKFNDPCDTCNSQKVETNECGEPADDRLLKYNTAYNQGRQTMPPVQQQQRPTMNSENKIMIDDNGRIINDKRIPNNCTKKSCTPEPRKRIRGTKKKEHLAAHNKSKSSTDKPANCMETNFRQSPTHHKHKPSVAKVSMGGNQIPLFTAKKKSFSVDVGTGTCGCPPTCQNKEIQTNSQQVLFAKDEEDEYLSSPNGTSPVQPGNNEAVENNDELRNNEQLGENDDPEQNGGGKLTKKCSCEERKKNEEKLKESERAKEEMKNNDKLANSKKILKKNDGDKLSKVGSKLKNVDYLLDNDEVNKNSKLKNNEKSIENDKLLYKDQLNISYQVKNDKMNVNYKMWNSDEGKLNSSGQLKDNVEKTRKTDISIHTDKVKKIDKSIEMSDKNNEKVKHTKKLKEDDSVIENEKLKNRKKSKEAEKLRESENEKLNKGKEMNENEKKVDTDKVRRKSEKLKESKDVMDNGEKLKESKTDIKHREECTKHAYEKMIRGISEYIFIQSVDIVLGNCKILWKVTFPSFDDSNTKQQECVSVQDIMQYLNSMNRCGNNSVNLNCSNICCQICKKWIPLDQLGVHEKWCTQNLDLLYVKNNFRSQKKKRLTSNKVRNSSRLLAIVRHRKSRES